MNYIKRNLNTNVKHKTFCYTAQKSLKSKEIVGGIEHKNRVKQRNMKNARLVLQIKIS